MSETDWFKQPKSLIPWWAVLVGVGMFVFFFALRADAHSAEALEAWNQDWSDRATEEGLSLTLLLEWHDMHDRHACYFHQVCPTVQAPVPSQPAQGSGPSPATASQGMGNQTSDVERWRGLVASYFTDVDRALCVIRYESGGNPNARNPTSGAAGLFQVMPFWFDHFGGDRYDPANNTRVAALVLAEQGWTAWAVVNRGKC
jgi:hypothetical protein